MSEFNLMMQMGVGMLVAAGILGTLGVYVAGSLFLSLVEQLIAIFKMH